MPGDNENAPAGVSAGFTMSIPLPRLSSTGELLSQIGLNLSNFGTPMRFRLGSKIRKTLLE